ncbi:MAG TPA: glycosyltransferase [Candidatus Lustribacter sp.]|nr:glycosyltransferase [Candidatus Lustribacter sp.]
MISTFGARAEEFGHRLGGRDLDAVITDFAQISLAMVEAIRRREQGQSFYGMVLLEEPRTNAIMAAAADVLSQVSDPDEKRVSLDQLTDGRLKIGIDQTSSALWAEDESVGRALREFVLLPDAMLVRSFTEYARLLPLCLRPPRVEPVVAEPVVPEVMRVVPSRPSIVVWAPDWRSRAIAYHAYALIEFHGDVTCVTADGIALESSTAKFVAAADGAVAEALAAATCIVCVEPEDPGAAIAFARRGYGVVAPLTSGAHEYVRDVVTYDFANTRRLQIAASTGIVQPASLRGVPEPPPRPYRPALPEPAGLPLVSVVTPTYNRRRDLERMLGCIARQTYPNLEAVVVNDGGESVDDIVARFPFARVINLEQNVGVLRAVGAGVGAVRGSYIQLNADDDWLQPDHIEALVGAMLRSGAAVAHGNSLIRHQEREPDGSFTTVGFSAAVFNETTTPTTALMSTPIAGNSMIVRRDVIDEIGSWREDTMLHDQEFHMRAAARYVFAYVDRMTSEFRSRGKHQYSNTADSVPELRRIYDELFPVTGRPYIAAWRADTLERVAARPKGGGHVFPPTLVLQPPIKEPPL